MYSGVTADSTEVFFFFFYFKLSIFFPLIYTHLTLSLNNKDTIMKTEDNKVVIVDIGCVSALFLQWFVSFGTYIGL